MSAGDRRHALIDFITPTMMFSRVCLGRITIITNRVIGFFNRRSLKTSPYHFKGCLHPKPLLLITFPLHWKYSHLCGIHKRTNKVSGEVYICYQLQTIGSSQAACSAWGTLLMFRKFVSTSLQKTFVRGVFDSAVFVITEFTLTSSNRFYARIRAKGDLVY